jgi:dTDP-4-dehydrorhamnose reductase
MKVAVTGAAGQLGAELCRQLRDAAIGLTRSDFDLRDYDEAARVLRDIRPTVLINCAAYTQVDRAEDDPETCFEVNSHGVEALARICREIDCTLVQMSTDYVFGKDRTRRAPYVETDEPGPVNVYGQSKLAGEIAAAMLDRHLIVRTCGLYAPCIGAPRAGRNFVETILARAAKGKPLRVVCDQVCTPTYVPHVAQAICYLISAGALGTFHLTNGGAATWHEFAACVLRCANATVVCSAVNSADYGARAKRPAFSVLDGDKFRSTEGPAMSQWSSALRDFFAHRR